VIVYGKSLSKVMLILVFSVGLADAGVSKMPALVLGIVVMAKLFVTVWLFMTKVSPYVWPADASMSKA